MSHNENKKTSEIYEIADEPPKSHGKSITKIVLTDDSI